MAAPITKPIDKALLCDGDYILAAMIPIFARGLANYAGKGPASLTVPVLRAHGIAMTLEGLKAVFNWWCSYGPWDDQTGSCGEPDLADAAAELALKVGHWMMGRSTAPVGPTPRGESALVNQAKPEFIAWARDRCKRHVRLRKGILAATRR